MSHIFISYSRHDVKFARYLRALLEDEGLNVWMDEKRLHAGMDWLNEIEQAIDDCAAFIVIMSPESRQSNYVEIEVLHARDRQKPLFPVLLSGDPFFMLKNVQYETMSAGLNASLSADFAGRLRHSVGLLPTEQRVRFEIVQGDITDYPADVAVLKYAKTFHGADLAVARELHEKNVLVDREHLHTIGQYEYLPTREAIAASHVLFVGTPSVFQMGYRQVRDFAEQSLQILAEEAPDIRHIITTIHGVQSMLQLDEVESCLAQLGGYIDMLQRGTAPRLLERITILEINGARTRRLQDGVTDYLDEAAYAERVSGEEWAYELVIAHDDKTDSAPDAGESDDYKPFALAIMPDDDALDDIFYYGIQRPIHGAGLLCERIAPSYDTPDELGALLARIGQASVVICDVTDLNDVLHLQIGYAWGSRRDMVFITRDPENDNPSNLPLSPEPLRYEKIWQLEERLARYLENLTL